jgi:hypothetical protein
VSTVLVVGADTESVVSVLRAAADDVLVLDGSGERLERLLDEVRDARVWYLLGDTEVIPLPDGFVDEVVGAGASPEVERVMR